MPDFNSQYDITLKDILKGIPKRFVEILTGRKALEFLDTGFPKVEELKADLLIRLEDGNIFQLELQTQNDPRMPLRMLRYYTHIYSVYSKEPEQTVLYIGHNRLNMPDRLDYKKLKFSYNLKDIKSIDCNELLKSDDLNDVVLSVLCETKDERSLILEIASRLSSLKPLELEDYKLKFRNLIRLRPNLRELTEKLEVEMPITINFEDDSLYQAGLEKGIEKGIEKGVAQGLSIAKRNYIINSRKNLNVTPEQIALTIEDTVENVIAVLKEEGLI